MGRRTSLVAQLVKNPPAVQESPVLFLGREDPLEKGTATHLSILAWRIPWIPESMREFQKSLAGHSPWGHTEWTRLSDFHSTAIYWDACGSAGKESTCNAGDPGSIPGLGRATGERKSYPPQYSGLENSMD